MIPVFFRHVGSKSFPDREVEIPFSDLAEVVAVHGPNGGGKTTLLECSGPGSLFLTLPFRPGPLYRNFVRRGHNILTWEDDDGERLTSSVIVDPERELVEATLHDSSGKPIAGPSQRAYLNEIRRRIGTLDFMLCTSFAVQPSSTTGKNSWSFLRAIPSERRDILRELISAGKYDAWKKRADGFLAEAEQVLSSTRGELKILRAQDEKRAAAEKERDTALRLTQDAETTLQNLDSILEQAVERLEGYRARILALTPQEATAGLLTGEIHSLNQQLSEVQIRKQATAGLLTEGTAIMAAVTTAMELERSILDSRSKLETRRAEIAEAKNANQTAKSADQLRRQALSTAQTDLARTERQRAILTSVPCHGEGIYAACQFLTDASIAGKLIPKLHADIATYSVRTDIPPAPEDDTQVLAGEVKDLEGKLKEARKLTDKLPQLESATTLFTELGRQEVDLVFRIGQKQREREDLEPGLRELARAREGEETLKKRREEVARDRRDADSALSQMRSRLTAAETTLANLADPAEIRVLEVREAHESREVGRWGLLGRFLGPTGAPILKIDAALPAISDYCTKLLQGALGTSYALSIESQREKKDGDMAEDLPVILTRAGQPLDVALLSGGEGVPVSEALALAITLYHGLQPGAQKIRVLWRDEVAAALHPTSSTAYVAMLREAVRQGDFKHVLFVSHHERAIEKADSQIYVHDGLVEIS